MQRWFITGCDGGLGQAIALAALQAGHRVVVTGLALAGIAPVLAAYPGTARGFVLDVTDGTSIARVVGAAGEIDVLVNNAGYGVIGTVEETGPAFYRPMFEVNFFGLAEVTRAVLPQMRARRRGYIVNISSSAGFAAAPGFAFYAASKFAVEGFSEALAQEVAPFGIRTTLLEPGSFRTAFAGVSLQHAMATQTDYAQTAVAATRQRMRQRDGTQPGDPARLAAILLRLAAMPNPPFRLPLGADAVDRLQRKLRDTASEFEAWRATSLAVGFEA